MPRAFIVNGKFRRTDGAKDQNIPQLEPLRRSANPRALFPLHQQGTATCSERLSKTVQTHEALREYKSSARRFGLHTKSCQECGVGFRDAPGRFSVGVL